MRATTQARHARGETAKAQLYRLDGKRGVPARTPRGVRIKTGIDAAQVPRRKLNVGAWRGDARIVVGEERQPPPTDQLIEWNACDGGEISNAGRSRIVERAKKLVL